MNILKEHDQGISDSMIVSKGEISSYTIVINPPDTDRIFLHYPGTNDTLMADDMPYSRIKNADLFHFGYPPLMKKMYKNEGRELVNLFKHIKEMGLVTSLDMALPDPDSKAGKVDWLRILKRILPGVDIFLPSIDEILFMLNPDKYNRLHKNIDGNLLQEVSKKLLDMGAKIVVLKLGDSGLYLHTEEVKFVANIKKNDWSHRRLLSPCFQVEVKGTTGAGDATIAGFLAGLLQGEPPEKTLSTATGVGAFCVEAVDATGGIRPLPQVQQRIKGGWEQLSVKIDLGDWEYEESTGLWRPVF